MTRLLTPAGLPMQNPAGTILTTPGLETVGSPTHCWSACDSELATPTATQQSDWTVSSTQRVARAIDRGSGGVNLLADSGPWGTAHGLSPVPGPQYIPASRRFRSRPAWHFDATGVATLYSMLTPNRDGLNGNNFFNGGSGYAAPWWFAALCRIVNTGVAASSPWDCTGNGSGGLAGPTVTAGDQPGPGGTHWKVSNWSDVSPPTPPLVPTNQIDSGHVALTTETVLLICRCKSGTNNSNLWVYYRSAVGQTALDTGTGTLDANALREVFFGYVHESYMSDAAIWARDLTAQDLVDITAWAAPWVAPILTEASEP